MAEHSWAYVHISPGCCMHSNDKAINIREHNIRMQTDPELKPIRDFIETSTLMPVLHQGRERTIE